MSLINTFKRYKKLCIITIFSIIILIYYTISDLKYVPKSFNSIMDDRHHLQFTDRNGVILNTTYLNRWNVHNVVKLDTVPQFLKEAFIISEDKRFYKHFGIDIIGRFSSIIDNLKSLSLKRGGSTITEQVVRIINTRKRTIWSRWLEGIEAIQLEKNFTKNEILEFYLNQIPYAANRRGIKEAAFYYFNRNLDTLSKKEILALVILVRAPSFLNLWNNGKLVETRINQLTSRLVKYNIISERERVNIVNEKFILDKPKNPVNAEEFLRYVKNLSQFYYINEERIKTTLNANLQYQIQNMLDERLLHLRSEKVYNGAVLVVDHKTSEILAWVISGKNNKDTPGRFIDTVLTPRQPGSALKPLLYSLALMKGWSASTIIEDAPLSIAVSHGLHSYKNYSNIFYGPVTLRQALGNSLNIPAIKALRYVGVLEYLIYLRKCGFAHLAHESEFYGDGLALGNGEVSLYELVQAYAAIANYGIFNTLRVFADDLGVEKSYSIMQPEIASLIGNILSDSKARALEFTENSVLNLPIQTAVKTGTSSDYKDSWAVGFNYRYVVGIWIGNVDNKSTDGVTGSIGPALLLRSIFTELNKYQKTKPLNIHKRLVRYDLCFDTKQIKIEDQECETYTEWFVPEITPSTIPKCNERSKEIKMITPTPNLHVAYDPRIPIKSQALEFLIDGVEQKDDVLWNINGKNVNTKGGRYIWTLEKGINKVSAIIRGGEDKRKREVAHIDEIQFFVK